MAGAGSRARARGGVAAERPAPERARAAGQSELGRACGRLRLRGRLRMATSRGCGRLRWPSHPPHRLLRPFSDPSRERGQLAWRRGDQAELP
uniref:Uncharacterized protein n=1 Tax=Arundo donax TaxID=35708 RepID=A0A0A9H2A9_ARUDO